MQADLYVYLVKYKTKRPHQGRGMNGRTPDQAFKEGLPKKTKKKAATTRPKEVKEAA